MSTKNAYEIRLEVLQMANSNLKDIYYQRVDAVRMDAIAAGDESGSWFKRVEPFQPTPEQTLELAEKLYKFISQD